MLRRREGAVLIIIQSALIMLAALGLGLFVAGVEGLVDYFLERRDAA